MLHTMIHLYDGRAIGHKRVKKPWMVVPLCFKGYIWKEQNRRTFEDVELDMHSLKKALLRLHCSHFLLHEKFCDCLVASIDFIKK